MSEIRTSLHFGHSLNIFQMITSNQFVVSVFSDPESLTLADDDETLAGTSSEEPFSLSAQGMLPLEIERCDNAMRFFVTIEEIIQIT